MERPELSAHLGAAVLSACQPLTTIPFVRFTQWVAKLSISTALALPIRLYFNQHTSNLEKISALLSRETSKRELTSPEVIIWIHMTHCKDEIDESPATVITTQQSSQIRDFMLSFTLL